MEDSITGDVLVGLAQAGFTIFDGVTERIKTSRKPPIVPEIPSRPTKRANWILEPIAKNEDGTFAYALMNTSSAIVHNAEVFIANSRWKIDLIGDTDWPGEVLPGELLVFYAKVTPEMTFGGKPEVRLQWQDTDGEHWYRDFEIQISGNGLMDMFYTGG